MAHYVARELHMRPNYILDEWSVPELIVAYGQYTNEVAHRNYEAYKKTPPKERKGERPPEYHVYFRHPDDLETEVK